MKNTLKWVLIAFLLIGIIVGAVVLYNTLGDDYLGNDISVPQNQNEESSNINSSEPEVNDYTAPDFTVLDNGGNEVNLSSFKGKPVVLNFWATWCYYCREEMPDFNKAYKEFPDIQFLMINATDGVQETMEMAKKYIKDNGFDFDVFYDTELSAVNAYGVTGFPCSFFINANGEIVAMQPGMIDYKTLIKGIEMIRK